MNIVFMGTPKIAAVILDKLIRSRHDILAVITQPDRPKGRGGRVQFPAVKEVAIQHNINVYQPIKVKEDEFLLKLKEMNPDIIVVAAFGQILPKSILELPPFGCINVHASLLPKYRGAAPIQRSIMDGEDKTGITIMHMDVGLDTGDMIMKEEVIISPKETAGTLHDKLAKCGGDLLLNSLDAIEAGKAPREVQDDSLSSYASMLSKAEGKIDFTKPAIVIERLIRGLNPWPTAYTYLDGKTLKIWDADVTEETKEGQPGEIISVNKDAIIVKTGMGGLAIKELQLEGKKRMTVDSFIRGYDIKPGTVI